MTYLNVLGVPHAYRLVDKAKQTTTTLVFIHGWLLSQCYWQPMIDDLQLDFRCLSYDMRGFGASNQGIEKRGTFQGFSSETETVHPFSLAAYAQDLGTLLTKLSLGGKVWLVGHSLGGSVALWTAKLFPKQVAGVICVNAGGGVYLPEEFARFRQVGQQIVQWRFPWLSKVPFVDCAFAKMMVFHPLELIWGRRRIDDLLAAHPEAARGVLLESTTEAEVHQLPQVVAHLQQPVHFIAGANDTVMEEKYVRHLASFHPLFESSEGNVRVLEDCGHMAMVEQPGALATAIKAIVHDDESPLASSTHDSLREL